MKIILLILIFGAVFSRTSYASVVNVWYNYNYDLKQIYADDYSRYVFRAQVIPGDAMDMEILIAKADTYTYGFNIVAYEFTEEPSDLVLLNGPDYSYFVQADVTYKPDNPGQEGNYNVYSYHYIARAGVYFLGIYIQYTQTQFYPYSSIFFRLDVFKYKYSNIKNLKYNTDYELDTSIFSGNLIPYNYQIYIRIPVESKDKMEIQLTSKIAYNPQSAFKVDVCQYTYEPTDSQVYYPNKSRKCEIGLGNTSTESMKFIYPFETIEDIRYLSICITNTHDDLRYLYMYIYSEKGMAAAIIVIIILIPLLLIGGGTGYYVKRRRERV